VYGTGLLSSAFSPFLTYVTNATGAAVASPGPSCPADQIVPWNFNGFNLTGAGGASGNVCLYDNLSRQEIVPKLDRQSVFLRGTADLSANVSLFGEFSFVRSDTYFLGFPRAVGFGTGATFNPSTGRLNPAPTSLIQGHVNNPFARATFIRGRMDAVGPQDNQVKSDTLRGVFGAKATVRGYDVEAAYMYNRNDIESYNYNELRYDKLAQAFGYSVGANAVGNPILVANPAGGFYNFFNPSAGQVTPDMLRVNAKDEAKSTFQVLDVKGSGEVTQLAGGPLGVAFGAEVRKEERTVTPDANKIIGNVFGRGVGAANGERTVRTIFGEAIMPVVKGLELQAAARYDRYSDYGSSLTPKAAFTFAPTTSIKLRGSWARGFRAPSLTEVSRSSTSGFFNGIDDPRRCNRPTITVGCALSIPGLIVANPDVKPETARSNTLGVVWDFAKDGNLSVDYFDIRRKSEITFLSLTDILINEGSTDPRYVDRIVRDPANVSATIPNDPGAILFVRTGFANLGRTQVKGLDFDLRYTWNLGSAGKLRFNGLMTHYLDQRGSGTPDAPLVSYSGYRNAPEWRGQLRGTWERGTWTNTLVMNYVSGFRAHAAYENLTGTGLTAAQNCGDYPASTTYLGVCRVSEYYTFDASTEWRGIKNLRLNLAVRNLGNVRPSVDPLARPFNFAWYQPQGTNFVASARYDFK
jgi:iron complex outermembrane recepter protein